MTPEAAYLAYLEEKLRFVDDRMTSLEAALGFTLIKLNKYRMDVDFGVRCQNMTDEQYDKILKLYKENEPFSSDMERKLKAYYKLDNVTVG